jgi:hypothetical protein
MLTHPSLHRVTHPVVTLYLLIGFRAVVMNLRKLRPVFPHLFLLLKQTHLERPSCFIWPCTEVLFKMQTKAHRRHVSTLSLYHSRLMAWKNASAHEFPCLEKEGRAVLHQTTSFLRNFDLLACKHWDASSTALKALNVQALFISR